MDIVEQIKKKMQQVVDHLKGELKTLRTGRANPAMVEGVTVEVYGTRMRLKDMANISVPEPRQILIAPFDGKNAGPIAKEVELAIKMQASVDGNCVRVKVPEMSAAVRQEMVKTAKKKCEEAKIGIRNVRGDGNKTIKKMKADGEIPEDMMKKLEKNIQELTDKFCKTADDLTAEKEKEITTI